jgi:hypothetical protein
MVQVLPDKDLEQVEDQGWEEAVAEEVEWAAIDPAQARQEIACALIAAQRLPIRQVIPVTIWSVPNADQK